MSTGSENESAAPWLGNRKVSWAVVNGTVLVVLAFVLLFTGYIEGGAFVSLLTLALLVGLLTLFGDRIYQVTLFGSEIRLRRIEQDAAVAIQALRRSRIDNYRTSLRLSTKHRGMATQHYRDQRAEPLIGVVNMIGDAELTDELAQDIIDACVDVETMLCEKLAQFGKNLPETTEGVRMPSRDALPSSEQMLALHDREAATSTAKESDDIRAAVEDLRELIRLRHKAQLYV